MNACKLDVACGFSQLRCLLLDRGPRTILLRFSNCILEAELAVEHDLRATLVGVEIKKGREGLAHFAEGKSISLKWVATSLTPEGIMESIQEIDKLPIYNVANNVPNIDEFTKAETRKDAAGVIDEICAEEYSMRHTGSSWIINFLGDEFTVKDNLGARYIAHLLAHPATVFDASQLKNFMLPSELDRENTSASTIIVEESIEASTKENVIRLKRRELQLENEREREVNETAIAEIDEELELIEAELKRVLTRSGYIRNEGGTLDNDRKSVSNAIRRGIYKETLNECPGCRRFFDSRIDLGSQCMFFPAASENWIIRLPQK